MIVLHAGITWTYANIRNVSANARHKQQCTAEFQLYSCITAAHEQDDSVHHCIIIKADVLEGRVLVWECPQNRQHSHLLAMMTSDSLPSQLQLCTRDPKQHRMMIKSC